MLQFGELGSHQEKTRVKRTEKQGGKRQGGRENLQILASHSLFAVKISLSDHHSGKHWLSEDFDGSHASPIVYILVASRVLSSSVREGAHWEAICTCNIECYQWPRSPHRLNPVWFHFQKLIACWALVAHICNPSYSVDRVQEDYGLKPAWANSSQNPISKNPS
jgi:hypothetical protein